MNEAQIKEFREADYDINRKAAAIIVTRVSANGDCGELQVTAALNEDGAEKELYSLDVDMEEITSEEGQTFEQIIHRDALCYTLAVSVTAPEAQTVEEHQALTTGEGYKNILSASQNHDQCFEGTKCNLDIQQLEWQSFYEVSDYSGNMAAAYDMQVYAETKCNGFIGTLELFYMNKDDKVGDVDLSSASDFTLSDEEHGVYSAYDFAIEADNLMGDYFAFLQVYNDEQQTELDTAWTKSKLWSPPCYLVVDSFSKDGQEHSLSENRVSIDLSLKLSNYGDQACNSQEAYIEILDGEATTFVHKLSETDLAAANKAPFTFTVVVDSSSVSVAKVTYTDDNAEDDAV